MKKILRTVLPVLGVFAFAAGAHAQSTDTEQVINASIQIDPTLSITVDRNDVAFSVPTIADFEAGFIDALNGTVVSHLGNVAHDIQLQVNSEHFINADVSNTYQKPTSDLLARAVVSSTTNSSGLFASLAAMDHTQAQLIAGFEPDEYVEDIELSYRIAIDPALDMPDTYSASWTLTIVQQ